MAHGYVTYFYHQLCQRLTQVFLHLFYNLKKKKWYNYQSQFHAKLIIMHLFQVITEMKHGELLFVIVQLTAFLIPVFCYC